MSFDGKFSNLLNAAQLDGTFTAQGANPGALLELAGIKLPNSLIANRLGPFDLSAALTARLTGNEAPSVLAHHFSANLAALNVHTEGKLRLNSAGTATGELTVAPVDLLALTSALPEIFGSSVFSRADRKTNTDTTAIPTLQNLQTAFKWSPKNSAGPARLNLGNTRFDALGIAGTLQGETQLTQPVATTSLAIDLLKFSPKQVLTYFLKPVKTADPTALSSASGKVSFYQDAAGSHFRDLNIALDNSRLRGAISLLTAPQPTLRFDTTLDTLDLAGYLPPAEKNIRTDGSLTNYGALGRLPLPGEFLRAYDLSGSVRIEQLRLSGLQFTKAAARLTLGNGAATLDGLSARLYGGSFVGSVRSKAGLNQAPGTEVGPEISVTGDLQDVNVQLLLQALSNANEFTGRGDMRIELAGRGNTLLEATRSAAGDISLQLRNGTYTGINIGHELCKLYNRLRNKPAPPAPANNSTRFSTFSASAIVTNGAAQTSDLIASNNYLKLSGNGLVNLAEASINYSLDIELTGPIEETNCDTLSPFIGSRIPVRLTGTLANPSLQPDFGKLARREIRRQVEDRLTEKLLDLLGKKITGPTPQPWPEPER